MLNSGKARDLRLIVSWTTALCSEFHNSRLRLALAPQIVQPSVLPYPDWLAPPPDQLKLNSSVVICKGSDFVGIGVSIRDDKGRCLLAHSSRLPGIFAADMSHFMALH